MLKLCMPRINVWQNIINKSAKEYHVTNYNLCKGLTKQDNQSSDGASSIPEKGTADCRVTKYQKYLLVWSKHYKNVSQVPDLVSYSIVDRSQTSARIKINVIIGILTVGACCLMIISGKSAARRGESVVKMNEEFHKQYNASVVEK